MLCWTWAICFSAAASSENEHEFRLKDRARALPDAVQRGSHPADHWMPNPALDVLDGLPYRLLVPAPIQGLRGHPELDDEVVRVIGRFRLVPFFSPEAHKGGLVAAHNDTGIGADEALAVEPRSHDFQSHFYSVELRLK
jgi:hypothetical protein